MGFFSSSGGMDSSSDILLHENTWMEEHVNGMNRITNQQPVNFSMYKERYSLILNQGNCQ